DREFAAALVFPNVHLCRGLCSDIGADAPVAAILQDPRVGAKFRTIFEELARQSTGSSTYVKRVMVLDEPPSIDTREITDKGSLNQKAVLLSRRALVEELYAPDPSARVIAVETIPS